MPEERILKAAQHLHADCVDFVRDNANHADSDLRWIAFYVQNTVLRLLTDFRNGPLNVADRLEANKFHAAEIEAELNKKRDEIRTLEFDLKNLHKLDGELRS